MGRFDTMGTSLVGCGWDELALSLTVSICLDSPSACVSAFVSAIGEGRRGTQHTRGNPHNSEDDTWRTGCSCRDAMIEIVIAIIAF